jgi:hypothetical protein
LSISHFAIYPQHKAALYKERKTMTDRVKQVLNAWWAEKDGGDQAMVERPELTVLAAQINAALSMKRQQPDLKRLAQEIANVIFEDINRANPSFKRDINGNFNWHWPMDGITHIHEILARTIE